MLETLISTKFHNPLSMGRLTDRPRLDARLDESLSEGCRLVLVTAPAGFGKSTLVSAWLKRQAARFSWLSLDGSDNDPRQFMSYLVGALLRIDPHLGSSQVNRIQTADGSDTAAVYADVMVKLINEINDLSQPFVLVLDDCHLLKNALPLQLLTFLIEHQPSQMRLFLLSREDLPLPVARLRVRRQVVEIRQADLQFSSEEAEDFLRLGMGIQRLSRADILALEQHTEGWIAGLQLAGLSIQGAANPTQFIQSFTGSDRYILDYLTEEVVSRQPEEIRSFLLATSILDRFCAPLSAAVVGEWTGERGENGEFSRTLIERLERANLFLFPLDYARKWYRYHHLFADLLRHSLSLAAPEKIPSLHLTASRWLEANGLILEAVKHAFQTRDWQYTADLVERHAWNQIMHSRVSTVAEWCRAFPEHVISKRPALCIFHAWALVIAFKKSDFPAAEVRLEQAEGVLAEIDQQLEAAVVAGAPPVRLHTWVKGQIILLRSFLLMTHPRRQADPQALTDLGQSAYDHLPVEDIPARSAGMLDLCYARQALWDAAGAEKKFEQTIAYALSGRNYFGAVIGEYHRAHGLIAQGRLRDAVAFCARTREAYQSLFEHPLLDLPALALLDQAEGCARLELNDLAEAERLLRAGLEVGQWMPREELPGYLGLARLCAIKGDEAGWAETLRRLEMRWPDISYCIQAVRALEPLRSRPDDPGIRQAAAAWAAANAPDVTPDVHLPGIGPAWNDEADYTLYTAWAQIKILLGAGSDALAVIDPLLAAAEEHALTHRVVELSLLKAQVCEVLGQREKAWDPLGRALSLGEENGYLRLADQGSVLVRLLVEAARRGIAERYIARLLENAPLGSSLTLEKNAERSRKMAMFLQEPLSARELEVLALMAEGLSTAEIAARLYLSPNTLKAHTQNIFGKLDVHNRIQAVNRAREIHLI